MKVILYTLLLLFLTSCTTTEGVLKQQETGAISISEKSEAQSFVFLNNQLTDTLENGKGILNDVEAGEQTITLFSSSRSLSTEEVKVQSGKTAEITFDLKNCSYGDITVIGDSGAEVVLSELSFGALAENGEMKIAGFPTGEHALTIQDGSKRMDTMLTLSSGSSLSIDARLTLQQQVLVEHISNVSCEYCPHHAEVMYHVLDSLGWKNISKISYNANWPATDDPLYLFNPKPQLDRAMLYGADVQYALPIFVVNGTVIQFNADNDILAEQLSSLIEQEQQKSPSFDIVLTDSTVKVTSLEGETFKGTVRVNLVQDRVSYEEAPGSNGESLFHQAFRYLLLDESISVESSESTTREFSLKTDNLPETGLSLTAFIQDNSNKVIQTVTKRVR